jgi:hypothetical protein
MNYKNRDMLYKVENVMVKHLNFTCADAMKPIRLTVIKQNQGMEKLLELKKNFHPCRTRRSGRNHDYWPTLVLLFPATEVLKRSLSVTEVIQIIIYILLYKCQKLLLMELYLTSIIN